VSDAVTARPDLSVVVPSFDRRRQLEMVLAGLAAQRDVAPGAFETIVVLDGSTDDSATMLAEWERADRLPGLRWMLRPNAGQAAARHAGVLEARAPAVLFLDDDIVPAPGVVARHLAHHARGERIAVLGDCEVVRGDGEEDRFYLARVWGWWEDVFSSRARPGRLPTYPDFCAGHVSLRRDDYLASGGFDPAFRGYGGEDYDLGWRLLRAGVRYVPDRRAHAMHHHRLHGDYAKFMRHRQSEGHAEVRLARKHPELRAGLRLMRPEVGWAAHDRMMRLAFTEHGMRESTWRRRVAAMAWYERLGLRARWGEALTLLGAYAYWRGVHEALGSRAALDAFRAEATVPTQVVDIARGLPDEPPADFWVQGPSDVRVVAGDEVLGTVRLAGPVTEPLRAALAAAIERQLAPAVWAWAERAGVSILPPRAAAGPGADRSLTGG
jgi:GT2 family glycosyltransferase